MKHRYQLRDGLLAIDADYSDDGRRYLQDVRRRCPGLFAAGRIRDIIQAMPSQLPTGVVYEIGGAVLGTPESMTH